MTSPTSFRRHPPGRYDPPSKVGARMTAIVLAVLFFAFVAAVVGVFYQRLGGDEVRAQVIRYEVLGDAAVRIELEVTKPAGSRAYCIVRSRGRDGAEVGREILEVDAAGSPDERVRVTHELATTARAVTGEAGRCSGSPIPAPSLAPTNAP